MAPDAGNAVRSLPARARSSGQFRRCLIADRSDVFADGLEAALATTGLDYGVVGRARDPDEVMHSVARTHAEIVLAGFEPVADSAEVARRLHPIPVLVFSWSRRKDDVIATIRAGAAAFILKASLGPEELRRALHDVELGRSSFELGRQGALLQPDDEHRHPPLTRADDILLTPREHEIVSLIVDGYSNKQIALALRIAQQTVKNHLRNIMAKSSVSSRLQLCAWALAAGIGSTPAHARSSENDLLAVELRDGLLMDQTL